MNQTVNMNFNISGSDSLNPQSLKSYILLGVQLLLKTFLKKNRKKWCKVGKNALILQVEKMI
jgi:hypothetical protein